MKNKKFNFQGITFILIFLISIISVKSYLIVKDEYLPMKKVQTDIMKRYVVAEILADEIRRISTGNIRYENFTSENKSVPMYEIKIDDSVVTNYKENGFSFDQKFKKLNGAKIEINMEKPSYGIVENIDLWTNFNNIHQSPFIENFSKKLDLEFKNMSVKYYIPQKKINQILNTQKVKEVIKNTYYNTLISFISYIAFLTAFLCFLLASFVPTKIQKKELLVSWFCETYLEIKLVIIFLAFILIFGNIQFAGGWLARSNDIYYMSYEMITFFIMETFLVITICYLCYVYLKTIFIEGFQKTLINKILFYDIARKMIVNINIKWNRNLEESNFKKIFLFLLFHLFFILFCFVSGSLGFILMIIYTVFMYKCIKKYSKDLFELKQISEELCKGNFDFEVDLKNQSFDLILKNLVCVKNALKREIEDRLKSERMKTDLISNVSHDLKTPLTSIITYIDLIKSIEIDNKDLNEYTEILEKKSKRLKTLIEDLFEASKATSGNLELKIEKLDIISLFRQTVGELDEKISNSNLEFKYNFSDEKLYLLLDGRRMYRVFENLISNILKYSMEKTRVYINITKELDEVILEFKNISSYEMNFNPSEITERFVRADESRNTEGSGLGLAISKNIVELQNGKFNIYVDGDLFKVEIKFFIKE